MNRRILFVTCSAWSFLVVVSQCPILTSAIYILYLLTMIDFINSLSLESGALIVVGLSMFTAIGWGFIKKKRLKWTLAVIVPYSFDHSLYWLPV